MEEQYYDILLYHFTYRQCNAAAKHQEEETSLYDQPALHGAPGSHKA